MGWKASSDCRSMDYMLSYRRILVLMGMVVWSRYTRGGIYCEIAL